MFSSSHVPSLARLLFRAHHELMPALDIAPCLSLEYNGSDFSLTCAPGSASVTRMQWSDGKRTYRLRANAPTPGNTADIEVQMLDHTSGKTVTLKGHEFFNGAVPSEFKALHEEVLQNLKKWLPEDLGLRLGGNSSTPRMAHSGEVSSPQSGQNEQKSEDGAVQEPARAEQEGQSWQTYVIPVKEMPDVRFTGRLVAKVASSLVRGRWSEMHAYETKGGKFVGVKVGRSYWLTESDRTEVHVADSKEDLLEFFGHSELGKALAQRLGILRYRDIE